MLRHLPLKQSPCWRVINVLCFCGRVCACVCVRVHLIVWKSIPPSVCAIRVKTVCVCTECVCVCVCGCVAVVGVVSGSIWVSWKPCGVRKTTSHKSGGSPMFYKDRTLLRMSLRKTLGFSPYVGWKACVSLSLSLSLSLSTHSLSLYLFFTW